MNRLLRRPWLVVTTLLLAWILTAGTGRAADSSTRLVVSPNGPYTTIQAALAAAHDGDVIEVRPGTYAGPVVVEKSVTLEGVDWPIVDGGDDNTVITLAAPGSIVRGFNVQGSGNQPDQNHAGIVLMAADTVAEGNRLSDVLVGILVAEANGAVVRGNEITGKAEYDIARKGDGIRMWYSENVIIENNHVYETRDVVGWYSKNLMFRDNVIENGRYGMHFMYSDGAIIERNRILNNSVGIYVMYTSATTIRENTITGQRGPSGYALAFKDAYNVEVVDNLLVDNRAGLFLDGTPFRPDGFARYTNNIIAFNDVGVILQPAVQGNIISENTFWENVEQVSIQGGGGQADRNTWQGNYWSDYTGFDGDGDGYGDLPYQSERFFESLYDREQRLRALIYSPAVQAIEFAAAAFPVVRPQPKLTDSQPAIEPAPLPASALPQHSVLPMLLAAAGVLGMGIGCGALAFTKNVTAEARQAVPSGITGASSMTDTIDRRRLISAENVAKRYGKVRALNGVSFEAHVGEAIALWGPNGAGKTTLIKAILGLIAVDGEITINGLSVRRQGKQTRSFIGYVPQEAVFYDWTVSETMSFYARLKNADTARIPALLERLGLTEHRTKRVPALSGGLKQRLALAVALLSDPPVLLLDEPTANLDAQARRDYLALLKEFRTEGKLILFASHRFEELDALADRVLVLAEGRITDTLNPATLYERLAPELDMALRVPESQRKAALDALASLGMDAHFNGRGTVVVRVPFNGKMHPLDALTAQGITVLDFDLEQVQWN